MSTYYKKINGKNYDKTMLEIADGSVSGKGDGRISLADSRHIVNAIKDGGKVTDIEKRTLSYILENYKLTETALKHIEKSLSDNLPAEIRKEIKAMEPEVVEEYVPQVQQKIKSEYGKTSKSDSWKKKLIIIILILLLALLAIFAFLKFFCKTDKITTVTKDGASSAANESAGVSSDTATSAAGITTAAGTDGSSAGTSSSATLSTETAEHKAALRTGTEVKMPEEKKTEPVKERTVAANEYVVKQKDSLVTISEEIYGDYRMWRAIYKLNKKKIANPRIIFPGQVFILPEKK